MRSYIIDELGREDVKRCEAALQNKNMHGSMEGLYWITLPEEMLEDEQKEHLAECGPYGCAVEPVSDKIIVELLVRARSIIRCSCIRYANAEQRAYVMDFIDNFLKELDISV